MDVALLMANASQLKAALEQGPRFSLYTPIITLISISLFLQVTVGVLLIFIEKTEAEKPAQCRKSPEIRHLRYLSTVSEISEYCVNHH
ncbi:ninjurin-1-like [Sander lucioperca]|uniref:ninjurin-1-like n=1 Tax=Sander lucioperca TaxID=283035 RepID=UPI00125E6176|nr:ninjurin-1-like [Sander lucioperca]